MRSYPGLHGIAVLVVEDEPTHRTLVSIVLKNAGCQVTLCNNGREAIEVCLDHRFDAILMDLKMPEMCGFEAIRLLRANSRTRTTPIIIVSALAAVADQEAGQLAGADGYITKPYTFEDLLDLVASLQGQAEMVLHGEG